MSLLTRFFPLWAVLRALGAAAGEARTIAIEVGMQNSGLAVALASYWASRPPSGQPAARQALQ